MSVERARPKDVVLLMGPTASGKTDLALQLAERFPIQIISVDSAMVYRGMNIGTGKPSADVLGRFPHALVDILDPAQSYSAGQFVRDAREAIELAHASGKLPMLVGGTMLYFRALRHGLAEMPQADPAIRVQLDVEANRVGWPQMHAELARIDPRAAMRIQPNDAQRIQRALEVYRITGRTLSEHHASQTSGVDQGLRFFAYAWVPSERERIYDAIERRFDQMMQQGLLDEVRALYERTDLHPMLPSIRSVGYRQLWEHLSGSVTLDSAVKQAILATRHLARRQLIWLRSEGDVSWIDALESTADDRMVQAVASVLDERQP